MPRSELSAFMSAVGSCVFTMLQNVLYIQRELPNVEVSDAIRSQILSVCSDLVGTKHDVQSEVDELRELDAPDDSAVVQDRVARIERWLSEDLPALNALVMALEPTGSSAYLLVAESAVNILNNFRKMREAADHYREVIHESGRA